MSVMYWSLSHVYVVAVFLFPFLFKYSFPDCNPSLAIIYCDGNTINQATIKRMDDVQKQFKNAFVIAIGFKDDYSWNHLQMLVENHNLRFFRVFDWEEAAKLTLQCHAEMSQKEKFNMQTTYFQRERERLVSAAVSRSITKETFGRLDIPDTETDGQIVMEGFPSIYQIVNATREVLAENSPASYETIEKISAFFEG